MRLYNLEQTVWNGWINDIECMKWDNIIMNNINREYYMICDNCRYCIIDGLMDSGRSIEWDGSSSSSSSREQSMISDGLDQSIDSRRSGSRG